MKKIRVHITEIKNNLYAKIPDVIGDVFKISNGDDIEITIHEKNQTSQEKLWDVHPEDINSITFSIHNEVHSMNMYNKIYIPETHRFFFPSPDKEFLLITDIGNIKTSLSQNGYLSKGLRQWFALNGPLMPKDEITINLVNEEDNFYELFYHKEEKINE